MKKVRKLTSRKWSVSNSYKAKKIAEVVRGWINYFKIGSILTVSRKLDTVIRYRFRMCIWKHWKNPKTRYKNLVKLGISKKNARCAAGFHGYARVCRTKTVCYAMSNARLKKFGLLSAEEYLCKARCQVNWTAGCGTACPVVWEVGGKSRLLLDRNTNHWLRCHHLRYRSTRLTKHRWYSAQAQCSPHWWYQCDTPDRPNRTTRSHRPRTSGIAFHATRSFWSHRSGRPLDRYVSATGSAAVITTISGFIIWTVHNKIPCIKFVVAYILCRSAAYEKNTAK